MTIINNKHGNAPRLTSVSLDHNAIIDKDERINPNDPSDPHDAEYEKFTNDVLSIKHRQITPEPASVEQLHEIQNATNTAPNQIKI